MATTIDAHVHPDKHLDEPALSDINSMEKGAEPMPNLDALAQAAAHEHSYTPLTAIRIYWRAFGWCMFMSIGALLWGYDAQVGGGILSVPSFRRDFGSIIDGQPVLSAAWQSGFNSASSIGGMFGGLSLGWIADHFGRRGAVAIACCVSIVAIILQFFTPVEANPMLLVGKLINGFALGMYVSSASSYSSEISPLALRGITTGAVNLWIVLGQFLSNGVIEGTGTRDDKYAYRLPFAIQWIFPVILLAGLPFAPESPWWLVRKGRNDDARKVIARLAGADLDLDLHVAQIRETIELEEREAASASYLDLFRGVNLRRTIVASMVFVLQQVAGVVFVLGFSTYFFELAGFADENAFRLGVGVTAIGIVGNLIAGVYVNKFGRRFLFNWGMVGCAIVNFLIAFLALPGRTSTNWAMAIFTLIYNLVYQVGIGPLGYVIFAEVSSAKLRSKTVGFSILINSLCGMIANIVIPYLVNPDEANLGGKVGFIFGGLGAIGTVWAWFFIPETKNRTVDELDVMFERRITARKFGEYKIEDVTDVHEKQ